MGPPVADAVAADVPAQRSPHAGNTIQRLCHGEAATEGSKDTVACRCLVLAEDCSSLFCNLIGEAAGRALQCHCRMALSEMAHCWGLHCGMVLMHSRRMASAGLLPSDLMASAKHLRECWSCGHQQPASAERRQFKRSGPYFAHPCVNRHTAAGDRTARSSKWAGQAWYQPDHPG